METPGGRIMKCFMALSALVMASASLLAQQAPEATVKQNFASGGTIRLHLQAGGYIITPTDSDNIVVTCQHRSEEKLKAVRVAIKPVGTRADVYVLDTPNNNFTATIQVPRRSDLWVRLTAGELDVGSVEGNKDLELNAGSLRVDVPRPQDYGPRDASVTTGSIESSAFEVSKGGLFRSFHQHGPGKYRLHAYVIAGEIVLRGGI
jgi:hypothetical protein